MTLTALYPTSASPFTAQARCHGELLGLIVCCQTVAELMQVWAAQEDWLREGCKDFFTTKKREIEDVTTTIRKANS